MHKILVLAVLLILLSGCLIEKPTDKQFHEDGDIVIHFCPEDACMQTFDDFIDNNTYCALYNYRGNISPGRLVTDYDRKSRGIMHNKFCVKGNQVMTGSYNYGSSSFDNLIIIDSTYLAKNYMEEFLELRQNVFGQGIKTKYHDIFINNIKVLNLFCPEDQCRENVIHYLNNANTSIHFLHFSFTDIDIMNVLIEKNSQIKIRGIMEGSRINMKYNLFKKMNVSLDICACHEGKLHNKIFIIDERIVITGSYNPTLAGNNINDENLLIMDNEDIARRYLDEFNRIQTICCGS